MKKGITYFLLCTLCVLPLYGCALKTPKNEDTPEYVKVSEIEDGKGVSENNSVSENDLAGDVDGGEGYHSSLPKDTSVLKDGFNSEGAFVDGEFFPYDDFDEEAYAVAKAKRDGYYVEDPQKESNIPLNLNEMEREVEVDYPWLLHTCDDNDFYVYYADYQMLGYALNTYYEGKVPCNFTCNLPDDYDEVGNCVLKGDNGTVVKCYVNPRNGVIRIEAE